MKTGRAKILLRCLRQAAPDGGLTDGQLLGRYVARRDDDAFEALVRRHGPMVLAVCRRVLRHAQDAEDAFQATFLILAKRAAAVAGRAAVGGWLHTVAYHAALAARASGLRRKARERQVEDMPHPVAPPKDDQRELLELLDRELARLPEKYRLPVVLCELEGRSRREAARELGLPEGTLSSRLAAARKTLAARLSRYGAAVTAAALTGLLAPGARAARVPGALAVSTIRAAGGVVPAGVAALAQGVMKAMLLTKLKGGLWALLVAAAVGVSAAGWAFRSAAADPPRAEYPTYLRPPDPTYPGRAAESPATRPAAPDDLESLRREVEALKERVKALENQARVPSGGIGSGSEGAGNFGPGAGAPMGPPAKAGSPDAPPKGQPLADVGFLLEVDTPADLDAAMQKLRQHPDDKPALAVLQRAIRRLMDEANQFKAKVQEKCEEARKLEQFEQAVQRLNGSLKTPPAGSP